MTTTSATRNRFARHPSDLPPRACCPALWASPLLPAWAPALPVPQAHRVSRPRSRRRRRRGLRRAARQARLLERADRR